MTNLVDWNDRIYGRLLLLYPADLRRDFGAEMAFVFSEDLAVARREAGAAGMLRVWRNTLRELLCLALPPLAAKPVVAVPVLSFAVNFLRIPCRVSVSLSELPSNWLFRLTEDHWAETARSATRKRVLVSGVAPATLFLVIIQIAAWGGWRIGWHAAFQLTAGALLVELMFWTFDKVPFTCSYFPGKVNLSILFARYLYGLTTYSFHLADLELAAEQRWSYGLLYLAIGAVLLVLAWRRRPAAAAVRFDASEPAIQTLDLN